MGACFCCCCKPSWYDKDLYDATPDVPKYRVRGVHLAKIVKVYDGDTCTAALRIDGKVCKVRVRLVGIDTPELKTQDQAEKRAAEECRDFLSTLIFEKVVWLFCEDKDDKYGRVLAVIIAQRHALDETKNVHQSAPDDTNTDATWLNVNLRMLDLESCVEYGGGSKMPFQSR